VKLDREGVWNADAKFVTVINKQTRKKSILIWIVRNFYYYFCFNIKNKASKLIKK
jgi:hypothetical protein